MNMMFASVPVEHRTLFLGDLSIHCTEQIIHEVFSRFGVIEQIRLKNASMNNELSYAFVTFVYRGEAENALRQLNGTMLLGRRIRLGWATPKNSMTSGKTQQRPKVNPDNLSTAQIHFSFIAKNAIGVVTEETIRELFGSFGEVIDVSLKKSEFDHRQNVQSGYGFLHYPMSVEGIRAAINATNTVQKIAINRIRYDSCLTRSLQRFVDEHPELSQLSHSRRPTPVAPVHPFPQNQFSFNNNKFTPAQTFTASSNEDLDISSEILSLTESDSDSQPEFRGSNNTSLNGLFTSSPQMFYEQPQQPKMMQQSEQPRNWSPARMEFSTYGFSALNNGNSFASYNQTSYTMSQAW